MRPMKPRLFKLSPLGLRRWQAFKANRRGYYALWIFAALFFVSLFAEMIANDEPLLVIHDGRATFPFAHFYAETVYGGEFKTRADFSDPYLVDLIEAKGGRILFAPIRYDYASQASAFEKGPFPSAPDGDHLLGTDGQGRDILARLIYGYRLSVIFALLLTLGTSVIGIWAGATQGYFGGWIDLWGQRFLEIWESMPSFFILITVVAFFTPSFFLLLGIMLIFGWTSLVGVVRAEFLRARNFDYVKAARALGHRDRRIMFEHVLPNAMVAALTFLPFLFSGAISALTALDYLGYGLPPGSPSLGEVALQARVHSRSYWIGLSIFVTITLILTLLVFIGEAIRDAFDPRKVQLK